MIKKVLVLSATILMTAGLAFSVAWLLGVDFGDGDEADSGADAGEATRFGEDGVTICVEGIGVAVADEIAAEGTVVIALTEVTADPNWSKITETTLSADDQVRRGCDSKPVALQPDVEVVGLGGKGLHFEGDGVPIVSERDPTTDIRVYVLTPAVMARTFGEENQAVLTSEAWIVSGDQAWGVNMALYLSSDVVDDLALISERLRRATGLWYPYGR
ncbi:MAG: hypothetical protein IIC86_06525 [Chloroflexi bacterium]|nr:hypothetical protein [Chloroflexota bacterium]